MIEAEGRQGGVDARRFQDCPDHCLVAIHSILRECLELDVNAVVGLHLHSKPFLNLLSLQ